MEYGLTLYRQMADDPPTERELRFRGPTKYAALSLFMEWARPRMGAEWEPPVDDLADLELWFTPIQAALGRPRLMIELAYKDASEDMDDPERLTMPYRWLVSVAKQGWQLEKVHAFADDPAGVEACLREIVSYLLEDEGLAWGG